MADVQKKVVSSTSRVLVFIVVIETLILALFIFSGFNKINPYALFSLFVICAVLLYFYLKKPKSYDIYKILSEWRSSHYRKLNILLDTRDFQVIPVTPTLFYIHLPNEGLMAYFENGRFTGIENNHIYRILKRNEKSKLVADSIKYLGTESKLRQVADAIGADKQSLGLE